MRAFCMKAQQALGPAFIGAIGVVFGDIGTSPLYAFKESLGAAGFQPGDASTVLGLLSLIFWSLAIVVSVKYLAVIMRADNHGEGGILSLVALVQQRFGTAEPWARRAVALGVLGAALFYCDALITPAISVLSAVEGLEILNPDFARAVIPVTLGVIVALFAIQRRGTERVGRMFGPIMILWFVALAVLGAMEIVHAPQVLAAVNPWYALRLFGAHPGLSLVILGAVFLVVTGAEALYADMGHFGRKPVAIAWLVLVWPALLINYFGQGALLHAVGGADRQSVLCAGAAGIVAGAGAAVDGRHCHRLAGHHLGRVLGDARGRAARPAAARARAADLGGGAWTDLRARPRTCSCSSRWCCSWSGSAARARCRPRTAPRWLAPCSSPRC